MAGGLQKFRKLQQRKLQEDFINHLESVQDSELVFARKDVVLKGESTCNVLSVVLSRKLTGDFKM